jgi:hypothetical protein
MALCPHHDEPMPMYRVSLHQVVGHVDDLRTCNLSVGILTEWGEEANQRVALVDRACGSLVVEGEDLACVIPRKCGMKCGGHGHVIDHSVSVCRVNHNDCHEKEKWGCHLRLQ